MKHRPLLALVAVTVILATAVAVGAKDVPTPAQGVHVTLGLAEYPLIGQPRAFECGGTYTTQTWIIGKLVAWADVAGTANVEVRTFYGDEVLPPGKVRQPKFDRLGIKASLTTRPAQIGDLDWFGSPDDRGEPYLWQFDLVANGVVVSSCEFTLTRI